MTAPTPAPLTENEAGSDITWSLSCLSITCMVCMYCVHPELFPAAFHNQDLSVTHIDALPPHRGAQYGQQQRGQAILPLVVTCFLHSFPQFSLAASTAAIAPVAATATTAPCPPAVTSLPIACCPAGPCPPALFPSHCLLCCRCCCASICTRSLPLLSPAVPLLLLLWQRLAGA